MSRVPRVLLDEEVGRVVELIDSPEAVLEVRSWIGQGGPRRADWSRWLVPRLAVLLGLEAGLRLGEMTWLRWVHLGVVGDRFVEIALPCGSTKSKASRRIPVPARLGRWLDHARELNQIWLPGKAPIFVLGWAGGERPMTCRQVARKISAFTEVALGSAVNPHALRHTYATRLSRVSNIRVVQQLLGHKHVQTTQIYTHVQRSEMVDAVNLAFGSPSTAA